MVREPWESGNRLSSALPQPQVRDSRSSLTSYENLGSAVIRDTMATDESGEADLERLFPALIRHRHLLPGCLHRRVALH